MNTKLKILLISAHPMNSIGGIASWTKEYINFCDSHDILCRVVDTSKRKIRIKNGFLQECYRTYKILYSLNSEICKNRFDIVHLNSNIGFFGIIRDYLAVLLIKRKNIPIVTHFHCDVEFWLTNKVKKNIFNKLLILSDVVIVLSENSRQYVNNTSKISTKVVPNFIDTTLFCQDKIINKQVRKIIYTGRVSRAKGCSEIFEIAKSFPNIDFILIGNIIDEDLIRNLSENVKLMGAKKREEVLNCLEQSDLFLFPSHTEGFSVSLMEAMAVGLPSIVTNVGANFEMVGDDCGIVVEVGNIEKMKSAIYKLQNPKIREKMSKNAKKKVFSDYDSQIVLNEIIKMYYELTERGKK